MSLTIAKSANFGKSKTGLSTVGYTLKNPDGTTAQSRTTSGITELQSGQGIYGGSLVFSDTFSGMIIWDTGDATPLYAVENFDYRNYTGSSGSSSGGGGILTITNPSDKAWTEKEKKKVIKLLDMILAKIDVNTGNVLESLRISVGELKSKTVDFSEIKSQIRENHLNLSNKLKELEQKEVIIPDLTENLVHIEAQYEEIRQNLKPIIEGLEALIESETVNILLKGDKNEESEEFESEN